MASSTPLNTILRCDIRYTYYGYPTELTFRDRGDYPNADMIRRFISERRLRHAILRRSFVKNKDSLLNAVPPFHTVAKPELDKMKAEEIAKSPRAARRNSARGPRRPNHYQEEEEEQSRRMTKSEIRSVIYRLNAESQGAVQAGDLGTPADKSYIINGGRITSAPPLHMRPRPRTALTPKKASSERLTQRPRTSDHVRIADTEGALIEDCKYFNS